MPKSFDKERELGIPPITFLTYLFIPLSVGMFLTFSNIGSQPRVQRHSD